MKKNIVLTLTLVTIFMLNVNAQAKYDLEKLAYRTAITEVLKGKDAYPEEREMATTLPCLTTSSVNKFKFGTVEFTNGGQHGAESDLSSTISFLFTDQTHTKLAGLVVRISKKTEAKKLGKYIAAKYGKGTVLAAIPKPRATGEVLGYPAVFYLDKKTNQTIVVADNYAEIDGKPDFSTDLFILNNGIKVAEQGSNFTVVERIKQSYKRLQE
ncbi:hypothetical protein HDE69_005116 [Pedobacter cryoconitis]|uniref:Uncharacterized protein n=1 Tax=Pedobacter cryoconitis TaxID=188932 RepID=A0A7W8YY88_9SPHI|nr:hypothetical protein [Pedobacter cryoconitis]MBB5624019.1 hypothetical protein [Pedobacter cryoconitis]